MNRAFVDFEHGLNTAVNKVRQALLDSASAPKYVETVPGKGYRFLLPVAVASEPVESVGQVSESPGRQLLATPQDLPAAPRALVRALLLAIQAMYLAFYLGALGNLPEIREILEEARLPAPAVWFVLLIVTAAALIPVRLFLSAALAFDIPTLPLKFRKLFPVLLCMDLSWGLSPFLLVHHVNLGIALGMCAALVYIPFAQRSLILMLARAR